MKLASFFFLLALILTFTPTGGLNVMFWLTGVVVVWGHTRKARQ